MNIHPILVHFPIALLTTYAFFECIRFKKLMELREWFYIKATFLFLGGLGALAAAQAGDFGKQLYPSARAIIQVHENFAKVQLSFLDYLHWCILAWRSTSYGVSNYAIQTFHRRGTES